IIDWLKSGYDTSVMEEEMLNVLPDGRILCLNYEYDATFGNMSWSYNDMYLSMLTEIPPEELPDKKSVKLYALSIDRDTRMRILEFNRSNLEYEIELTSYADYTDGADRMNTAMISGNIPDVILMGTQYDNTVPVENYISKGLFADIYKFIDDDPEMERGDFLDNVLKAYEVDGRLYQVVPMFQICTIACKTDLVGETQGWTMDEFIDFVDAHPDCTPFNSLVDKKYVLELFINSNYESYIDMETGRCSFDSGEFIRLLEFCNRFPDEVPENAYMDYNFYKDDLPRLRSGERLLYLTQVIRCSDIRHFEKGYFNADVTFKGYPSNSGNGSSIQGEKSFAITAKAANPDGAWQFVRYFLGEEYQDMCVNANYLPVRVSSLEKQAEACKERPYYIDTFGEKQYYDNTFFNGSINVNIGVNTDGDNEKILEFIRSADSVYHNDKYIKVIVQEEAGAYFAGQKSAEEVAQTIQNRVQNYLDENR
ncbi:MAG: extracellular solute-binding protein, partial [Oscillospiraceae bacterium]|nr:extracellular solute-binding protein [Oscillospiraceae bacterium]